MKRMLKIILITTDADYAAAFAEAVAATQRGFIVCVEKTRKSGLAVAGKSGDAVLLTDMKDGELALAVPHTAVRLSVPHESAGTPERQLSVNKYAGCGHICSAVRRSCPGMHGPGNGDTGRNTDGGTIVISLLGIEGGAGTSSIALGLAGELSAHRGRKVMVLSFETFESPYLGAGPRMRGSGDVADFLFGFLRTGIGEQTRLQAAPYLWRDDNGVIRFMPSIGTNRLCELTGAFRERFVDAVAAEVRPDVILLDMGSCIDADAREWMRASASVIFVGRHGGVKTGKGMPAAFDNIAEDLGIDAERAIHVISRRPADTEDDPSDMNGGLAAGFTAICEDPYAFENDGSRVAISLATAFGTGIKELADRVLARDMPDPEGTPQDIWPDADEDQEEVYDAGLAA